MDEEEYMLTTEDNPYNPFTQFNLWYHFDLQKGYNTCSYLARIVKATDELGDAELLTAISRGTQEILSLNLLGKYCTITRSGKILKKGEIMK